MKILAAQRMVAEKQYYDFQHELNHMLKEKDLGNRFVYSYLPTRKGPVVVHTKMAQELFNNSRRSVTHIHWLVANKDNMQGSGREAMEILCKLADKWGEWLELYPMPISGGPFMATEDQLIRFYKSFGFVEKMNKQKEIYMVRKTKKVKQ